MLKKLALAAILLFLWIEVSRSLFHPEFFKIHDFVHGARIAEMTIALRDGHFPVRWSENFGYGYGMPLFEFYAPLPFYVGSLVYWLTGNLIFAVKFLFGFASAVTIIGAFWLGSKLFGRAAGLVTTVLFTLAPYRAVNLYVRGAVSEAWGMMVMPWILLGGVWVIDGLRYGWLVLVLSITTLMLSHNLTTLMFIPLSAVFLLSYWWWRHRRSWRKRPAVKKLGVLAGSYVLAGGLAAFYMLPAFVEKNQTKINSILGGYFDYHMHFIYIRQLLRPYWGYGGSAWGVEDGLSFFLGWGALLGLTITGVLLLWQIISRWRSRGFRHVLTKPIFLAAVAIVLLAASLYMTLEKSLWLWEVSSFLSFIQFPWRWLGPAMMWLALLIGMAPALIKRLPWRYGLTGLLVLIPMSTNWSYFVPESFLDNANALYYDDPVRVQVGMSEILPDYIPIQMSDNIAIAPQPRESIVRTPASSDIINTTEVLVDQTHQKLVRTNFAQPGPLEFYLADFPGWQVEIDGQPAPKLESDLGTIVVDVPAASHLVGVRFGGTPVRQLADVISVVSLIVVLYLVLEPIPLAKRRRHD